MSSGLSPGGCWATDGQLLRYSDRGVKIMYQTQAGHKVSCQEQVLMGATGASTRL